MTKLENFPQMEYRSLGRSGLKVSALSLGGWMTYGAYVDRERTFACMKAAYDVGCNFFDCAENYMKGECEKLVGEAIKEFGWKRSDIVISTKLYWGGAFSANRANSIGLSRKHIIEGLNGSLDRLQLSYVDVLFASKPDRQTPIEETVRAFDFVINQGKALYWGTSHWSPDEIAEAWRIADRLGLIGPVAEQSEYHLMKRNRVEGELARLCRYDGLGLAVFSPLRAGVLSGKYRDGIPPDSRMAQTQIGTIGAMRERVGQSKFDDMVATARLLEPIAERLGVSQAILSISWVLKNSYVSTVIMGASQPEQVYENAKAVEFYGSLTREVMDELDAILGNKPPALVERF